MIETVYYVFSFIVFLVHPVSTAAIDGTTVEFTCTAENATLSLAYVVNDTAAAEHSDY